MEQTAPLTGSDQKLADEVNTLTGGAELARAPTTFSTAYPPGENSRLQGEISRLQADLQALKEQHDEDKVEITVDGTHVWAHRVAIFMMIVYGCR